jgi:hypothetical protein
MFYGKGKFRMKRGLSAQKNHIGQAFFSGERIQPGSDRIDIQGFSAMLGRIYIAVAASEVACCQNMKKNIGSVF